MLVRTLAQTSSLPLVHWQMHQPNHQAKAIVLAEDKVYCATEDCFFYYDKTYNQLKTLWVKFGVYLAFSATPDCTNNIAVMGQ